MGYELLIGPEGEEQEAYYLGTGRDVSDFVAWAGGLPGPEFARLRRFAAEMATTEGTPLAEEIGVALYDHPPAVRGVEETARLIAETTFLLDDGVLARIAS